MGVRNVQFLRSVWPVRDDAGQTTVELVVVLPVAIMMALVVVNALTFFGTCASFDRVTRQAICTYGAAPDADRGIDGVMAQVQQEIEAAVGSPNVSVAVQAQGQALGLMRFTARLDYRPTLFGVQLRDRVFGLVLPPLTHEIELVVDMYRPGVLL